MRADLLLFALVDAMLEETVWFTNVLLESGRTTHEELEANSTRLGQWRALWWGKS